MSKRINQCRVSGSRNLLSVLHLGDQCYTGIFPKPNAQNVPIGPLELLWCPDSGLVQLAHHFDLESIYGDNYGYRSGLNASMVRHLTSKTNQLARLVNLKRNDWVLDVGSNDATLLKCYQ